MALDEERSEERRYLAEWFWRIKSSQETLMAAIDPALDIKEDTFKSINIVADLAGHCTRPKPFVLAPLVDKWKPFDEDVKDYSGIDYNLPLREMLKGWKNEADKTNSSMDDRGEVYLLGLPDLQNPSLQLMPNKLLTQEKMLYLSEIECCI